jgi:uncharacterized repeat protein (TIGR01451 family)
MRFKEEPKMNSKQYPTALAMVLALLVQPRTAYADGPTPVGPELRVNTYTTSWQWNPSVAMDADGDFVVVWASSVQDGDSTGVYAQRYRSDGTPDGGEFRVNTTTTDYQGAPSVAMDADGDFVVAWECICQSDNDWGVYAQRYTSDGTPDGGEFQVNTYTTNYQWLPSVAMDADGDFVIAWESYRQDGSDWGVYAQRYTSDGTPDGDEFQVNTYTSGGQWYFSVAMDADGDFIIAWSSDGQDGDDYGVYAQRYQNDGTPDGSEFQVNTYTASAQGRPSVAMDADGDFVIAWDSWVQGFSDVEEYAQRYTSDGMPVGSEFQVNTYTTDWQYMPSVAMDTEGDFVIAWQSYGQDGSDYGVYAQRYTSDGTPDGGEFQVNTYTNDRQLYPSVATDSEGDFVVAWTSDGQDGDYYGVYAQRYAWGMPTLTLVKSVDDARPEPGQLITFTLTITNSSFRSATGAAVSDTLPSEFNFVGPITLDPPGAGAPGTEPPILASELTISPYTRITLTFPATVSLSVAKGRALTNTAAVTSTEVITPQIGVQVITIPLDFFYLPIVFKNSS